ncbi:hypothetical protein AALM99_03995 [Lactococcus muris]|uniref:Uncharacterized protein n=1 Tax=Lactococcus muris TaxID=2941330 RepID=A0ABV4D9H7_9LACT
MTKKKMKWNIVLFLAIALFGFGLFSGQVFFNIPVIVLAFIIHRFGNPILFKEYYDRKRKSQERFQEYKKRTEEKQ